MQSKPEGGKEGQQEDVYVYLAEQLACQGLHLRGRNVDTESNFIQLLRLHSADADVDTWLSKKSNKYTSNEIEDIILEEMVHKTLYDIGQNIHDQGCQRRSGKSGNCRINISKLK